MGDITPIVGRKRGKKPVNLVAATGYRTPQDAVWEAVRKLKQFTLADVMAWLLRKDLNRISQETAKSYLVRLQKGDYINVINVEKRNNHAVQHTYELIKDVGVHAPRLTKEGKPSTQGMGRENMWKSMKILKSFDYKDLVEMSSNDLITVKPADAKDYIKHLNKAGYLRIVVPACKHPVAPARYCLIPSMNTGYHPPMVQRVKRVFDPNLNQVMNAEGDD